MNTHAADCLYVPLLRPCNLSCAAHRAPILVPLDLTLGTPYDHPTIRTDGTQYLARIRGRFHCGTFSRQWYGLNFNGWITAVGLQYDKPGTNYSHWQDLWEIA
jgi:hypothetical protein